MNESLKSSQIPFFSPEELNDQHQSMKDAAMDHLKGHSKGPEDFILSFLDNLQQVNSLNLYLLNHWMII